MSVWNVVGPHKAFGEQACGMERCSEAVGGCDLMQEEAWERQLWKPRGDLFVAASVLLDPSAYPSWPLVTLPVLNLWSALWSVSELLQAPRLGAGELQLSWSSLISLIRETFSIEKEGGRGVSIDGYDQWAQDSLAWG